MITFVIVRFNKGIACFASVIVVYANSAEPEVSGCDTRHIYLLLIRLIIISAAQTLTFVIQQEKRIVRHVLMLASSTVPVAAWLVVNMCI